jgi:hypothetical protein
MTQPRITAFFADATPPIAPRKRKRSDSTDVSARPNRVLQYFKNAIAATPKKVIKTQLDVHHALNIARGDPEGILRKINTGAIAEQLQLELEVDKAFYQTRRDIEAGKKVPLDDPFRGHWELYSSQYFGEHQLRDIDIIDFENITGNAMLCFHRVENEECELSCCFSPGQFGMIVGYKELTGRLQERLEWPSDGKFADLKSVVMKTEAACGELRIWFGGDGDMRLACNLSKGRKKPTVCSFSGIQMTREKKMARFMAHMEKMRMEKGCPHEPSPDRLPCLYCRDVGTA